MTINPGRTRELDIETIVLRALQLAGLVSAGESTSGTSYTQKRAMALDYLDVILKDIQSRSLLSMHIVRTELAVLTGTSSATLATSTLACIGDAYWKPSGSNIETLIKQMALDTYMQISDKTTTGSPQMFYAQKSATGITIKLWPVPAEDGTLAYQEHRLIADGDEPQYTVELERHWTKYLMWELAHYVATASSLPEATVAILSNKASAAMDTAKAASRPAVPFQVRLNHRTQWS